MADHVERSRAARQISDVELVEMGRRAQTEKERLLARYPHLQPFQQEIDRRLAAAGTTQNRLAVLGFMIEAKLGELREQMDALQDLTRELAQSR